MQLTEEKSWDAGPVAGPWRTSFGVPEKPSMLLRVIGPLNPKLQTLNPKP